MTTFRFAVGEEVIIDRLMTYRRNYNPSTDVRGIVQFQNVFTQGPKLHAKGRWFQDCQPGEHWYAVRLPHGEFEDVPDSHLTPANLPPIVEPL